MTIKTIKHMTGGSILAIMFLLLTPSAFAAVDVEGSVGIASDYFFRGESINAGDPAKQVNAELSFEGFYGGVFASDVSINDADIRYDIYGGYRYNITDQFAVDSGVIQYRYDEGEATEEWYVSGSYQSVSVGYFVDMDDSENSYVELNIGLPFIPVVDTSVSYGRFDEGGDFFSIKATKTFTNGLSVVAEIADVQEARSSNGDDSFSDHVSVGLFYNF
jgi:uncharacterized protein (TIGR02001 family)